MMDVQEPSTRIPSPPQSDTEVSDDEAEYFYPSDRRGLMSMPSPVKTSSRRLSFPLQKSDFQEADEEDDQAEQQQADESSGNKALHHDQDAVLHNITTPSNETRKLPRRNSTGSPRSPHSRKCNQRVRQPKASESIMSSFRLSSPELSNPEAPVSLEHQLSKPPMRRSSTAGDENELNKPPPVRRRSTVGGNGAADGPPARRRSTMTENGPPARRRSTMTENGPPARRRSTMAEDGPATRPPARRSSTMGEEDGTNPRITIAHTKPTMQKQPSANAPRRIKSTMDATFSWQPRPPQNGRRRSSMPKNSRPGADATELFYVDPFASTSKEEQKEKGKKIEQERITRRNSLPSAADFNPELHSPPPTRLKQSKSQDFSIPFHDDDPYDEEGNLIRRKAPRRRSVTNTPQRFQAVDATTPDFQQARKLTMQKNMTEAMQIDPFAATPELQKTNLQVNKNVQKAMQIDPFENAESKMANKPRKSSNADASSDDDDTNLLRSSKKKGKTKRRGSLTLSGHLRKGGDKGKQSKDTKTVESAGSKNSADTRSTANSTDPSSTHSNGIHTSDFKLTKPRIEKLKGEEDEAFEAGFRLGRRLSTSSSGGGSQGPRRTRSKNARKNNDEAPTTPTKKKGILQRLSQSPRRAKKRFTWGNNNSNHSRDSSDDDSNLLSVSPIRKDSMSRERRAGTRRTIAADKLDDADGGKRKKKAPDRTKSDAGPRAIRISMSGNVDLLTNEHSREPGIRQKRSTSADEARLYSDSDGDDEDHGKLPKPKSSNSLNATPLSRIRKKKAEKPSSETRRSGGSSRRGRRASIGTTTAGAHMVETEQMADGVSTRLPSKAQARTSKSPSPRKPKSMKKMGRRNSVF